MATEDTEDTGTEESLRDSIEAAFDESAEESTTPASEAVGSAPKTDAPSQIEPPENQPASAVHPTSQRPVQTAPEPQIEPPPQSWKAPLKERWGNIDPEVRREILRRENETSRVLGESAQSRQVVQQLSESIRPFEARLRTNNVNPIQAFENLLKADHLLSSAPPVQRAQYMAKLIQDYGVDIKELDAALAGQPPVNPVTSQVEQLLQQRLAPIHSFLQQQQAQAQAEQQVRVEQAGYEIQAMAQNTAQFPHFDAVRDTMADLVEFYATKRQYIPLDQLYHRAVSLDPTLSSQVAASQAKSAQLATAAARNVQAQRAQAASMSVSGGQGSLPMPAASSDSLRDSVEAAWAAHSGR